MTITLITGPGASGKSTVASALGGRWHAIGTTAALERLLRTSSGQKQIIIETNDDSVTAAVLALPNVRIYRIHCTVH